jgi:hypothetical protein
MYKIYQRLTENARIAKQVLRKAMEEDKVEKILTLLKDIDPSNKYLGLLAKTYVDNGYMPFEIVEGIKELNDCNIKLKDVSKIKNTKDLLRSIKASLRSNTKIKKGTLKLIEGEDYIKIWLPVDHIEAYIPINATAMKVLGNEKYGGVTGEWCISQNNNLDTYLQYVRELESVICIVIDKNTDDDYAKKFAVYYGFKDEYDHELTVKVFDATNELSFPNDVPYIDTIYDYLEKNYDSIRNKMSKK